MKAKLLLISLMAIFFILPFLLWGNTYVVGGDDTRLYYIFPHQFLSNYVFNIISDNTLAGAMTGYATVGYFAPFFYLIHIAKIIPVISTQMMLYGLNFAFGFLGFYFFLRLWTGKENTFLLSIVGSVLYVSSIYITKTLYTNQLLSIYLVSALPWTLYLFMKGVRENKRTYIIYSIALFSLLSTTINTLPWWGAFLVASLPLFIWLGIVYRLRLVTSVLVAGITFLFLNGFWIFHFLYSYFFNTGLHSTLQYYSSSVFIKDNLRIIFGVSNLYSPLNVVFQQMDTNFITNFSANTLVGGVFFIPLVLVGFLIRKIPHENVMRFGVILSCFLLSWFLFSPGFGNGGGQLFLYLGQHVPFFTMFRNMYDKFALSVAFYFACLLVYSLWLLKEHISKNYYLIVMGAFCIFVTIFAFQSFHTLQLKTASYTHFSGEFNNDFMDVTKFMSKQSGVSKIVWLPLNTPTYVNVTDKYNSRVFYSGLSPLHLLTSKTDFSGRFSFITQSNLFLGDYVFELIRQRKYEKILSLLQQFNVSYIIIDKQQLPHDIKTFMYGQGESVLKWQDENFIKSLVGEKIKDFGSRYTVYKINPAFSNEKIYLTDNFGSFPQDFSNVQYVKNNSSSYTIILSHLSKSKKLVFLDPYYKDWTLYMVQNNKKIPFEEGENQIVFDYANGWSIDPKIIKERYPGTYMSNEDGSITVRLQLYFKPERYSIYVDTISIIGWLGVAVLLVWQVWNTLRNKL